MQIYVLLTALLATAAQAADLCVSTTSNCGGSLLCCNGINAGSCCNFGRTSSSIRFTLPANSRGQAWTGSSCSGSSSTFSVSGAGTFCQIWTQRQSARWLEGRGFAKEKRDDAPAAECAEPNAVVTEDGQTLSIAEAQAAGLL